MAGPHPGPDQIRLQLHRPGAGRVRDRTLSDLTSRGLNGAASALAQSADHIRAFFEMLGAELGFYLGCLNLRDQLTANGGPVCFPVVAGPVVRRWPPVVASTGRACLSTRGLYDASLALGLDNARAVGNDVNADGKQLIMITGANHGGKSTFLRASDGSADDAGRDVRGGGVVRRQRQHRDLHALQNARKTPPWRRGSWTRNWTG